MSERQTIGKHNRDMLSSIKRLHQGKTYKNLSTAIVCPSRSDLPVDVVSSWMGLIRPMNQICAGPFFFKDFEVGDAYNQAVHMVLNQTNVNYLLTIETDNIPPPDGLVKLLETINDGWDVVGGLYWTKGEGGQPMIYGDPEVFPRNFIPQVPKPGEIQRCNGLGMGFTLFKTELLRKMSADMPKDKNGIPQLFVTKQEYLPGRGSQVYTQDLWFFNNAAKYGAMIASDNRVLVGHLDTATGVVW